MFLLLLTVFSTAVEARTLVVGSSGGEAYSSIQSAIDASGPGDTVLVRAGRYVETLSIIWVDVYLISAEGPVATTIDGNGSGPVIRCLGLSADSSIEGFTITGGVAPLAGGGIYLVAQASPLIKGNIIAGNRAEIKGSGFWTAGEASLAGKPLYCEPIPGSGGGVYVHLECLPLITDNLIKDNSALRDGGGVVFWDHANARLEGNRIYRNTAGRHGGGVFVGCNAMPTMERNIIAWNEAASGGGIFLDGFEADAEVVRNTLYQNSAATGAGGIQCRGRCRPMIHANLIGLAGTGGVLCDPETEAAVTCNVVWGPGRADFDQDDFDDDCFPLGVGYQDADNAVMEVRFCGAVAGDFRPCTQPLLLECRRVGAIDEECQPGQCGTITGSWGILKALYRKP